MSDETGVSLYFVQRRTIFAAMRIVALETSGNSGSVAAADRDRPLDTVKLEATRQSGRSLAPAIQSLLGQVHWQPAEIELIALTIGPGSFTGLRVGVATAKVLAYATGAAIIGVNALEVIAAQASTERAKLAVAMDAQRSQVMAAQFARDRDGIWRQTGGSKILDKDAWLASLDPESAVTGPVLQKLRPHLPGHVEVVESDQWMPRAETVARLAWRLYQSGTRHDLWSLSPLYMRKSAAEEKLEQRTS